MARHKSKVSGLPVIHENAAGIDIGSRFHVVAVPPGRCEEPVQSFQAFTADLERMADWLVSLGITTVAMESTGVYWIAAYEILDRHGLEVVVANARESRAVPGRKSDVNDAQWLQRLHACGLLRASFHPRGEIAALRTYLRLRERHVDYAAAHIQHMQKALNFMNLQLHHVVSDVTGATGLRIIRAIVAGERNLDVLVAMRDRRCKATLETIRSALVGNYQPEHVFALQQALALYDFYQARVDECDAQIETVLAKLAVDKPAPCEPLAKPRTRRGQGRNELSFDVRTLLYQLVGIDLTQIHGIGPYLALRLVAECGTDLSRWPTVKHFTSWLTLAPGCKISGGKVLSSHTRKTTHRLPALLRLAAVAVGKTNTALGAFYRRLAARIGKAKAVTATARKKLRCCSTTRCALGCSTPIRAPIITSNATANGSSNSCTGGPPSSGSHCSQRTVFLRKVRTMSVDTRMHWIDTRDALATTRQCALAEVARSSFYGRPPPREPSAEDLVLMHLIDEEYTRRPFYGSRRMVVFLGRQGHAVNRKRVQRLMRCMGLAGMAPGPATSTPHPEHKVYPYLLRGVEITHPGQVWSTDICAPWRRGWKEPNQSRLIADRQLECCPARERYRAEGGCKAPPYADGGVS